MAVHKRKDTNKYEVRIRLKDGTKYSKSFTSKLLANKHNVKILAEIENGTFLKEDDNITVVKASEIYIARYININCKESTKNGYIGYLNNHILPYFGNKPMCNITKVNIEEFKLHLLSKMQVTGNYKKLANETINHILHLTGAIFKMMVDDEVIKKNPVEKVKKLPVNTKEANFLEIKEANKLLDYVKMNYPKYYALLLTAIITGARQGELLGLTWDDIDFENGIISINKTYSHGKITTPKTRSSIRNIELPSFLANVLKEYKKEYSTSDIIVFANNKGKHLDARNMVQRFFAPCIQEAGVKQVTWHELRHSCITALAENGVNIKYIQQHAGHSNINTTLRLYTHVTEKMKQDAISVLDSVYRPAVKLKVI